MRCEPAQRLLPDGVFRHSVHEEAGYDPSPKYARFTSTDRRVDATIRLLRLRSLFHPRMHRLSDRYGLSLESFRRIRRVFLPTNRTRLPSLFIYRLKIYNPDQNTKLYFPQASPEKRISRRSEEIVQTFSPSNRTGIPRQFADPPYPDNIKATPGMQEVSARPTSGGTIAPKFQSETGA